MTFQPKAPHKKRRWLALLAIVMLGASLTATSAVAHFADAIPDSAFIDDESGANDEPGQKDLTAQASAFHDGSFYSAWKWDDTSWSGKNTGDACSLFDTDGDSNANYAVCVTVGTKNAIEQSTRVYLCGDGRPDRCTGSQLIGTEGVDSTDDWCTVSNTAPGQFDTPASDTQATCDIGQISSDLNVAALAGPNLLNSCSYPSQQPNSDPSDCVLLVPANQEVDLDTTSAGTITWQATLTDTATLTPAGTGSVTFKLYSGTPCVDGVGGNLLQTNTDASAPFEATPFVVNSTDVTGDGPWKYYWTVTYNPGAGFNGDEEVCGEEVTITASVVGSNSTAD